MACQKAKMRVSGGSSTASKNLQGRGPWGPMAAALKGIELQQVADRAPPAGTAVPRIPAVAVPVPKASAPTVDAPVFPFDPLRRAQQVEDLVMQGEARQYYRFRPAPYYGGIATADAHGCDLLCAYCWNYDRNEKPSKAYGKFYQPEEVASELLRIAKKKGYHTYRLTGSEPILGRRSFQHFLLVKDLVLGQDPQGRFMLETNGLMLGHHPEFCSELAASGGDVVVRICIKGTDPESFEKVTGAHGTGFFLQLTALQELQRRGVAAHAAFMADLFALPDIENLSNGLRRDWGIAGELELEGLERYPPVLRHLRQRHVDVG